MLRRLISYFFGSIIFGFNAVLTALTFSALIYTGSLGEYYTTGFSLILMGAIITLVVTSLFSSLPTIIAEPQSEPFPIIVLMSASIAAMLVAKGLTGSLFSTVLVGVGLSAIATGITFFLLGKFKLGSLVSFMPYPVIGGFLTGVGWLLLTGSLNMLTDIPITYKDISSLFKEPILLKWIPALVYAALLLLFTRKTYNIIRMITLVITAFLAFYAMTYFLHIPFATLKSQGYLLNISLEKDIILSLKKISLQSVHWEVILSQAGYIPIIVLYSVIAILVKATGIEVTLKKEINFNRELQVAGAANILTGFFGGLVGYLAVNDTILNTRFQENLRTASRTIGLLSALFCLTTLVQGLNAISYLPRFIPGGMLMFFGLSYLKQWLIDNRRTMPTHDFLIILTILFVVVSYGVFSGILVGIVFSVALFIVNYSKLSIIKYILTGKQIFSTKQREPKIQEWLSENGSYLLYIKLQNYLFFGNASHLLQELKSHISQSKNSVHYVIYNFKSITGIDSSALLNFTKMKQLAAKENIILIFTEIEDSMRGMLTKGNIIEDGNTGIKIFTTYDEALEWYEEKMITDSQLLVSQRISLESRLQELFHEEGAIVDHISHYLEKITIKKGEYLYRQNDPAGPLHYIEAGYLSVSLETENHEKKRLRVIGPGNTVGEISFYLQKPRSASVIAHESCTLQMVSIENMLKMYKNDPPLASIFNKFITQVLSDRLVYANNQIEIYSK